MFSIQNIKIIQFKNYSTASFNFNERVIGICGLNGKGKTNLLDALHYCCFTKSYFSATDAASVQFDKDGFRLEADANINEEEKKITCIHRGIGKKEITVNDVPYSKNSEHIGKFPCIMVAPDDAELITGGSEERRRFVDTLLSQLNSNYLQQLIDYNKILQQRNSLLKQFAETKKTDWPLLDVLDKQLEQPGNFIFNSRKQFTSELIPLVQEFYSHICGNAERITLQYESHLTNTSFTELLINSREKDTYLQRTSTGIHKDDIALLLNENNFRQTASQGQRKSLLFALKLAGFELLKKNKGFAPLLLLDDVFEKLDDNRMQYLLQMVCINNDGQVFITDTHKERLVQAFTKLSIRHQLIELN